MCSLPVTFDFAAPDRENSLVRDDDVLQTVKELAVRERGAARETLSVLARRGLAMPAAGRKRPSSTRGKVITLEQVHRLMDQEGVQAPRPTGRSLAWFAGHSN